MSTLVNRGRRHRVSPIIRAEHQSPVRIRCPYCYVERRVWYDRLPLDVAEHDAHRLIQCPEHRCGVTLWAHIPPEWRERAEAWRPWQRVLDELWVPSDGPEPRPPTDAPPPPIIPKLAERKMKSRLGHYMLTTRRELAAAIFNARQEPDETLWPGAMVEVADLHLFVPSEAEDFAAMLASVPDVAALHAQAPLEAGELILLRGVRRGLDPECWWPLGERTITLDHKALDGASAQATQAPQALVEEPPAPSPPPTPPPAPERAAVAAEEPCTDSPEATLDEDTLAAAEPPGADPPPPVTASAEQMPAEGHALRQWFGEGLQWFGEGFEVHDLSAEVTDG